MRPSDSPQTCTSKLRPLAFFDRPHCHPVWASARFSGSRAWSFPTCLGSLTPRCQRTARAFRCPSCCLPRIKTRSAHRSGDFGAQYLACVYPATLHPRPCGPRRMTRSQNGALLLLVRLFHPLLLPVLSRRILGHLIRPIQHRLRNRDTDLFCRLLIYHQAQTLSVAPPADPQAWLPQDLVHIVCGAP